MTCARSLAYQPSRPAIREVFRSGSWMPTMSAPALWMTRLTWVRVSVQASGSAPRPPHA
nr:hypothetical protein [Asanoa ferruginea]